jgi:uncharacterized CHY-type Zn-finger protein
LAQAQVLIKLQCSIAAVFLVQPDLAAAMAETVRSMVKVKGTIKKANYQHMDRAGARLPKFGSSKGLKIQANSMPFFKCAKSLNKKLVPIKGSKKSRERCTSGVLKRTITIHKYGAFRCAPVSTCVGSNLTRRNCQDIGNQIAYDPEWREAVVAKGLNPNDYTCVSPRFIEWLAGVPVGWTSPKPMPQATIPTGRRYKCFDWFSGVGGLNFALHSKFVTVGFCEKDEFCTKVLEARMKDRHLDKALVCSDVETLSTRRRYPTTI